MAGLSSSAVPSEHYAPSDPLEGVGRSHGAYFDRCCLVARLRLLAAGSTGTRDVRAEPGLVALAGHQTVDAVIESRRVRSRARLSIVLRAVEAR